MTPEPLDPKRFHVLTAKQKAIAAGIIATFILLVLPVFGITYYNFAINRPSQIIDDKTVSIDKGESITEIGAKLYDEDIINSEFLFKLYVVLSKNQQNIQAGLYSVPSGTSLVQLVDIMAHGTNDQSITFLEGWRVEEYAQEAASRYENIDYREFTKLAKEYEGFLFPDTYFFTKDIREQEMIDALMLNFETRTQNVLTEEKLASVQLTKEQAVIFASIVEREVRNPEDRKIVAGILIKRWRNGELVGADATTQYIAAPLRYGCRLDAIETCPDATYIPDIQWWPNDLTQVELDFDNPYNTRRVTGIPPKPIANPSLNAIQAVMEAQPTEYNYYLTDPSGVTRYAKTLDEHNINVQKYL